MYTERLLLVDFEDLEFVHEKLRAILSWVYDKFGPQVITSLYRIGDTGVHGTIPLRAVDLRCRTAQYGEMVERMVNFAWAYDPDRPHLKVCMFHDTGRGFHLHFQVHPNTRMNGG